MNIRKETTLLNGVRDGNEKKNGYRSKGKWGKIGMRVLKRL